jgi:hypothetical protein
MKALSHLRLRVIELQLRELCNRQKPLDRQRQEDGKNDCVPM